MRMLLF